METFFPSSIEKSSPLAFIY